MSGQARTYEYTMQSLQVQNITIGPDQPLAIIAGPCAIESLEQCIEIGSAVHHRCNELGLPFIFKGSFDKANRTNIDSPRGLGLEKGLMALAAARDELGVPVTTDIHEAQQADAVGRVVDLIQIPAFLCRQTDLLVAAAQTGKPVNVKKGQFVSPHEMTNVIGKLQGAKANGIMLTERGTFFGYNRLVNDFIGLADMMDLGQPVCFDVTHSTQQPGGQGTSSGGRPDRASMLAKAAVAAGVQAVFIETHPNPSKGLSDAATMLPLEVTLDLLGELKRLRDATK